MTKKKQVMQLRKQINTHIIGIYVSKIFKREKLQNSVIMINDLIPNCLLLHLEAGRNLETFIASTYGLKPFSSTDTNLRKTAIMTKLKRLSLSLGRENESEKPPKPPLRASIAPELLLLTCCPLGLHKIGFPQAGSTELPPDPLGRGR